MLFSNASISKLLPRTTRTVQQSQAPPSQRKMLPSTHKVRRTAIFGLCDDRYVSLCTLLFAVTLFQLTTAQQAALSSTVPSLVHGGPIATTINVSTNCTNVRPLFLARGINSAEIPNAANHGKFLSSFFESIFMVDSR